MYEREKTISLHLSASSQPNNLCRMCTGDQVFMAMVHRQKACIVNVTNSAFAPVIISPSISNRPFIVTQVGWVETISKQHVFVVTGHRGVMLYDWDGGVLLKIVNLRDTECEHHLSIDNNASEDEVVVKRKVFYRGIAAYDGNIAIGCSSGEVVILSSGDGNTAQYIYQSSSEGTDYGEYSEDEASVGYELARFRWTKHPVVAIASCGNTLAMGDNRGNVLLGENIGCGVFEVKFQISSYGSGVTCMSTLGNCMLIGYISGHLRIFDVTTGKIKAEVCAHGRSVCAMDVVESRSGDLRVLTAGEDTFTRVWEVQGGGDKVAHLHSHCESNRLLTGAAFTDEKGNGYATVAYDVAEMQFFLTT